MKNWNTHHHKIQCFYMKVRCLLILLFCSMCWSYGQNTQQITHPNQLFQKGVDLVNLRQYSAAQEIFNEYINDHSDYLKRVEAEYYLAICAMELTQPTAEQLFLKFAKDHPDHPKARMSYYELGNFYFDKEEYERSIEYLDKIDIEALDNEQLLKAQFNLGYAYFTQKKYKKALNNFNLVKIDSDNNKYQYVAYYYAGYINYKEQNYQEALSDLQHAEKNDVYKRVVPYMITNVYNRNKQYDELIEYAEAKLSDDSGIKYSKEESIRLLLGEAYYKKQEYKKALPHLENYVAKNKSNKGVIYRLGDCYWKTKDFEKAEEYLKLVASEDNETGQLASYRLGHIYLYLKNKQFALSAFERASKLNHSIGIQEQALFDVAKLYYENEKFNWTINSLKKLNEEYPGHTFKKEVLELLSHSYLYTNNYQEAITYLESIKNRTNNIKKVYQEVTYYQAVELYNAQKFRASLKMFQKSVRQDYLNEQKYLDKQLLIQGYFWKGEVNSILRNWTEAKKDYATVFRLTEGTKSPYRLKTRYGIGYVYFNTHEYDKAKNHFVIYTQNLERAKDQEHYGNALLRVGDCYFLSKDFEKALTAYEKALKKNKRDVAYAYLKKAEVLGYLRRLEEAYKTYDIVVKQYANSPYRSEATYKKAVLSLENSLFQDAVKNFTYFLINERNSEYVIEGYLKRGIAYQNLKDYDLALTDFDKILKNHCEDSLANQALAAARQVLVADDRLDEYEERMSAYFLCSGDTTGIADKLYELSLALYRNRKYLKSIDSFERLMTKYPNNKYQKEVTNYTANAYYLSKDYDNAIVYFKKVEENGSKRNYQKALTKLSKMYMAKKDYENAKLYNLKVLPISTSKRKQVTALANLMNTYYYLGNLDSAKVYANTIIDGGSPLTTILYEAILMKGKVEYEQKNTDKALDEFIGLMNKATADETGAEANYFVGKILFEQGKKEQALNSLENLNKNFAAFDEWVGKSYLLISDIYIDMEEYFQARSTLESLVEHFPLPEVVLAAKEKLKIVDAKENVTVVEEEVTKFDLESGEIVTEIKKDTINTSQQDTIKTKTIEKGGTENE